MKSIYRSIPFGILIIFGLFIAYGLFPSMHKLDISDKIGTNLVDLTKKTVSFHGTSDDKNFARYLNIINDAYFFGTNHKALSKSTQNNTIDVQLSNINTPQMFQFAAVGDNGLYDTFVFVTPGDDIQFNVEKGSLSFTGKNAEHYNFFLELDKSNNQWTKLKMSKLNADFEHYKTLCDSLYKKRISFFDSYIERNKSVSNEFKKTVQQHLYFEYLHALISPRSEVQGNLYSNTLEDLTTILANSNRKEGDFFDLNKYLNHVTIDDFNKPELINNLYYKMSLVDFVRQYFVQSKAARFTKESFTEELTFIKKTFHPDIVKFATGRLIVDYFEHGFGKDKSSSEFMKNTLNEYQKTITDASYLEPLQDIKEELGSISKIIPADLEEGVMNLSKDTISLNPILRSKKIKIIDFWASWCQPCIEEIVAAKQEREKIMEKYDVEFIFLSVDKDEEKWIHRSKDLSEFLSNARQYRILSLKRSQFINFLKIKNSYGLTVPRYLILDQDNRIVDNNAPKPTSHKFEDVLKSLN
jgi:thiol-disulfide isomerase/thioredoxin